MIKKNFYSGSETEIKTPSPKEDFAESTTEDGARGINLVEMTKDFNHTEPEIFNELSQHNKKESSPNIGKVFDILLELGDSLDYDEKESLANFSDYLLIKFSNSLAADPTIAFNELMIKINSMNTVKTNEILKKLTKFYSRNVVLEYLKNEDLLKSKEIAYEKILNKAKQYLSEA